MKDAQSIMAAGSGPLQETGAPGAVHTASSSAAKDDLPAAEHAHVVGASLRGKSVTSARLAVLALGYPEVSLLFIRKTNLLRRFCIYVSHATLFENVILVSILCNCVTLGMNSNRKDFYQIAMGSTINELEYLWVAIFTVEALLKIVSMGFVLAPGTYLRDGWNVIDFTVVVLGYLDIFMSSNMTAIRTVRVLRPLRAITRIRGMKVLVTTMIASLPMLIDVLFLCAFTFFIWGLVAVQLFAGALRNRCGMPGFDDAYTLPSDGGRLALTNVSYTVSEEAIADACSGPLAADTAWYEVGGVPTSVPGPDGAGFVCVPGLYCTDYGNPNYGMTSFDNILWAWLTIFQCITLESWTDVMYYTSDAVSWWVWPFFVALVVFGAFYMISLALAVLFVQFSSENSAHDRQGHSAAAAEASSHLTDLDGGAAPSRSGDSVLSSNSDQSRGGGMMEATGVRPLEQDADGQRKAVPLLSGAEVEALGPLRCTMYRASVSKQLLYANMALIIINTLVMCVNWYGMPAKVEQATNYINYTLTLYFVIELAIKVTGLGFKRFFSDGMNIFDFIIVTVSVVEVLLEVIPSVSGVGPLSVMRMFRLLRVFSLVRSWRELHMIVTAILRSVMSTTYLMLLMLLFMFTAALMGMQLFGYKFMFCDYVEGASALCPLGLRVWGECPNHFNCYLPCSSDQYSNWIDAAGSFYNDLAYCDRFCASEDAAAAADANATAAVVEASGGCEYLAMVGKSQVPRAQFDNLFWGMYTVFQLLTGENWNNVMYDSMRTTVPWSALYFVMVLLLGTYLVFNLFIAILLDNFAGAIQVGGRVGNPHDAGADHQYEHAALEGGSTDKQQQAAELDSDADSLDGDAFGSIRTDMSALSASQFLMADGGDECERPGRQLAAAEGGPPLQGDITSGERDPPVGPSSSAGRGPSPLPQPSSPGRQQVVEVPDSPRGLAAVKGARGSKVVPVGPDGRPVSALKRPTSPTARPPPSALASRPSSSQLLLHSQSRGSAPSPPAPVADSSAAARRASLLHSHEAPAEKGAGGTSGGGQVLADSIRRSLRRAMSSFRSLREVRRNEHLAELIQGRSLLLFDPEHWVRWRAARLVHNTHFESVVLVLIIASSVSLALDTPSLDPSSRLATAIQIMDYIFTGAFALEAILKIVALGFAFTGRHAYIRNGWNVLDFVIVLVGFTLIAIQASGVEQQNLNMLRVLRTLRALRPLRAVSRYEGLKVVVSALFAVLPAMANVALVCLLFYVLFAILAVNLFKGRLFNCVNADTGARLDPAYYLPPGGTLTRDWCLAGSVTVTESSYYSARNISMPPYQINTAWISPVANFDNVGIAMLSLFQVATLELWVDIAFTAVDAVGVDRQPLWNHQPVVVLFFILFIVVCSFFILNLFVGVTLEKLTELQQTQMVSSVFVTAQQQEWVDVQKLLLRTSMQLRPARPGEPPWRVALFDFVASGAFKHFILGTILINTLFMAMVHADMSTGWQDCMSYTNLIFTAVFVVEAALKIAAFGPADYFRDKWNAFDFFVAAVSVATVVLDFSQVENLSFMPVLRVLRVVRVVRLIRRANGVQHLLMTLVHSLPALVNVGGIMLLFFTVFAIIGMNLFGDLKQGDFLNRHANFHNFPNAMLLLMRIITGESWSGIMQDCMVSGGCVLVVADTTSPLTNTTLLGGSYLDPGDPLLEGVAAEYLDNQCSLTPFAAVLYFPTFVILCGLIMLNLVIAVILENMLMAEADEALPVSKTMLGQFVDAWSEVDTSASGFVHASQLPLVIGSIDAPMGTRTLRSRSATQAIIMAVDIPVHGNNTVTFLETLHALSGRLVGTELPEIEEEWIISRYGKRLPGGGASFPKYTAAHFHAALYVKAAVRGFLARHHLRAAAQSLAAGRPAGVEAPRKEGPKDA